MFRILIILSSLCLVACAGSPQTADTTAAGAETVAAADTSAEASGSSAEGDDDVICKRVQVTGTRFKQKVCTTRAQREAASQGAASATRDWQNRNSQAGGPLNGG